MLALVTGGGGFLGRCLVRQLLARGVQVRSLGRGYYPDLAAAGVDTHRGDVRNPQAVRAACQGVDVAFHAAGLAGIWGRWAEYYETNVAGTRNVIQACIDQRVPKLVYTSSPSVTFDGRDQLGIDESAPYAARWLTHYPHSKALAEQAVLASHGKRGLATCALRPHLIWGPGDTHLVPRLVQRAKSGRLRRVGDGTNLIDHVFVENAAEAHLLAADALCLSAPPGGKAYFISQGQPVNCWQWINELLAVSGEPAVARSISFARAYRLGAACEVVYRALRVRTEPPMTRFLAAQMARSHYFDISAACRDFAYRPRILADEGLARMRLQA
jgi:nucleoside-diphosphate-sugar epimerase